MNHLTTYYIRKTIHKNYANYTLNYTLCRVLCIVYKQTLHSGAPFFTGGVRVLCRVCIVFMHPFICV